jgi:hypothetical protein
MKLIRVKADTILGLTVGITQEPKTVMLTISYIIGYVMLIWGDLTLANEYTEELKCKGSSA